MPAPHTYDPAFPDDFDKSALFHQALVFKLVLLRLIYPLSYSGSLQHEELSTLLSDLNTVIEKASPFNAN